MGTFPELIRRLRVHLAKRDFQRKRVYEWEVAALWSVDTPVSAPEARRLLKTLVRRAGCPPVDLHFWVGNAAKPRVRTRYVTVASAWEEDDPAKPRFVIALRKRGQTAIVLLHELAHVLTWFRHGPDVSPHGPEFMAEYLNLLALKGPSGTPTLERLHESARRAGIKIAA